MMKYVRQFAIPSLILVLSVLALRVFRVIPASKLWSGYSVLYVPVQSDKALLRRTLEENGVTTYLSLENQTFPLALPKESPEYSLSAAGAAGNYLDRRAGYFFDREHAFSVYYVPDRLEGELNRAVHELAEAGIAAGLNASSSYPWAAFVITLVFAAALVYFAERRILMLCATALGAYFALSLPFYSVASAMCLFLLAFFLSTKFWKRDGAVSSIKKNTVISVLMLLSVITIFLSGIKAAALFVAFLLAVLSASYIYFVASELSEQRFFFRPVLIRPASMVNALTPKNMHCVLGCFAATSLILVSAVFSLRNIEFSGEGAGGASVQLPSKNAAKKTLPDLSDYVIWNWNTVTFPYRSLNDGVPQEPKTGDMVVFPRYEEKNGRISSSLNSIVFDEQFKANAIQNIDSLPPTALEALLKKQGGFVKPGYAGSGTQSVSVLAFILLAFCALIPGALYLLFTKPRIQLQEKK